MSLYHETAEVLEAPASAGGNLKSRIFKNKKLKSAPAQVYALAIETCKWSPVLKEVIENSKLLRLEKKLTPILSLLLVHDLLLSKGGISLPPKHGLRISVERHKARLAAELTRARIRRKAGSIDDLRTQLSSNSSSMRPSGAPIRWVRWNSLSRAPGGAPDPPIVRGLTEVASASEVSTTARSYFRDPHVPSVYGLSLDVEVVGSPGHRDGSLVLQDRASCFPAAMLDPRPGDGDVVDACAAPGNKTTHLAALLRDNYDNSGGGGDDGGGGGGGGLDRGAPTVFAFERDAERSATLAGMVAQARAGGFVQVCGRSDFLAADPRDGRFARVGALLLDPSCSGSGIVGRDDMPPLELPDPEADAAGGDGTKRGKASARGKKTKIPTEAPGTSQQTSPPQPPPPQLPPSNVSPTEEGEENFSSPFYRDIPSPSSDDSLRDRLRHLSGFQLSVILHAFSFPSARRVVYSTCSVYAEENEHVVVRALASAVARQRGWSVASRARHQAKGLRDWPVRGWPAACRDVEGVVNLKRYTCLAGTAGSAAAVGEGDAEDAVDEGEEQRLASLVADSCLRCRPSRGDGLDDGLGTQGFFVAMFVREDAPEIELPAVEKGAARVGDELAPASGGEQSGTSEKEALATGLRERVEENQKSGGKRKRQRSPSRGKQNSKPLKQKPEASNAGPHAEAQRNTEFEDDEFNGFSD